MRRRAGEWLAGYTYDLACQGKGSPEARRRLLRVAGALLGEASVFAKFGVARGGYVAIQPSVANHKPSPRRLPREEMRRLLETLNQGRRTVLLLGDKYEAEYAEELATGLTSVRSLAGRTAFGEVVCLLRGAAEFVGHDGGLSYLANAFSVPALVLLGPTSGSDIAPRGERTLLLSSERSCAPCIRPGISDEQALTDCPHGVACMHDLSSERILSNLRARRFDP